ncbi:MAG: hypothetical protein R2751_06190 [Bacteroidales bacterium]
MFEPPRPEEDKGNRSPARIPGLKQVLPDHVGQDLADGGGFRRHRLDARQKAA